jgi:hypothetical protein
MNKIYKLTFLLASLMIITGCDDYLDINDDPNNPTDAPLSGLMTRTSFETGDNIQNVSSVTSSYVQYLASPNPASSTDVMEPIPYDQTWFELYDVMTDISDMQVLATEEEASHYLGIANILQAINLGLTVDVWGSIPYSEAFFAQSITPVYDGDEQLYGEIFSLLDEGIALLSAPNTNDSFQPGNDDFIYEGDISLWIKAANALKARYLLHASETPSFNAQAVLSATDAGFEGSDENATVSYFDVQINPWALVAINNEDLLLGGWISEQLIEAMDGTTYGYVDPRMPFMFGTTDEGEFIGTENGAGRGDAGEQGDRSYLVEGGYYTSRTSSLEVITYSEQKFIEAEAALSASNPTRAYDAYLEGIVSHMQTIGVPQDEIDAYLSNPEVSVGSGNLTLDLILKEKYIALFLNPETYNDARRYDFQYEDMTVAANLYPELNGNFATRLVYPDSETQRNSQNVPTVTLLDKIWWDQ